MVVWYFRKKNRKRGRDMGVTLSKFIPAERESDALATEELRSLVLSQMGGSFEEEIGVISLKGGCR